jgi:hypothetical protein
MPLASVTCASEWVVQETGVANPKRTGLRRRVRTRVGKPANKTGADFLRIDCQIALTFSDLALHESDPKKRRRLSATARKAYDTILRLRKDIELSHAEDDSLDSNLKRLKSELEDLGQSSWQ